MFEYLVQKKIIHSFFCISVMICTSRILANSTKIKQSAEALF